MLDKESLYNLLINKMNCGFAIRRMVFKNDEPIDYIYLDINHYFEKIVGKSRKDIIGKRATELFPGLETDWLERYSKVFKKDISEFTEYIQTIDKYLRISSFKVTEDTFATIFIDVTKLKNTQKELLVQRKKAEEKGMLKSIFLANMSHEIRTPMNAIIGFSDLLKKDSGLSDEQKKYLDIISNSSYDLLNLINNILDLSKIEANKVVLNKSFVDLNLFIKEIHTIFNTNEIDEESVKFKFNKCKFKRMVYLDELKLKQILNNLIMNALYFTTSGSVVFGYSIEDKFIKFYVKDTGIGIEEKNQELIFNRFTRDDNTVERGGDGLGLSIAKGLVEAMGGKIWFESEFGIGSDFYFTIPYKKM